MDVNDKVSNQSGLAVTRKKKFLKCQMNLYLFKRNTKNSYRWSTSSFLQLDKKKYA
jgi:hypothetical protein